MKTSDALKYQTYESFRELQSCSMYDGIITMNITSCDLAEIPKLPPKLQVLVVDLSKVRRLNHLPTSLRVIKVTRSKLEEFPEIEHLWGLESLDLHDCYIRSITAHDKFPPGLRTADLSFNKIYGIDWSCINPGLTDLNLDSNFLTSLPPHELTTKIQCHNNNFDERLAVRRNIGILPTEKDVLDGASGCAKSSTSDKKASDSSGVYENPENVHFVSIQQSAADSLAIVMELCPGRKFNKNFIREIEATYQLGTCCGKHPDPRYEIPPLHEWCTDTSVYTQHGISYRNLMERVWAFIRSRWRQKQMIEVMKQELDASVGLCMTGAFTRTISILSGFVDGVHIGISDKERLQERVAAIVSRNRDKYESDEIFVRMSKLEVSDVLSEMKIPPWERESWLDAIE